MYQIIIVPKDTGATACLYYNAWEQAAATQTEIQKRIRAEDGLLNIADDYGFVLSMDVKSLSYALLIDVNKSSKLHAAPQVPQKRIYAS